MASYQVTPPAVAVESATPLGNGSVSAVSWAAIFVGAAAAAALSLVLVILGFGLGLAAVSPWSHSGASASAMGAATIGWINTIASPRDSPSDRHSYRPVRALSLSSNRPRRIPS